MTKNNWCIGMNARVNALIIYLIQAHTHYCLKFTPHTHFKKLTSFHDNTDKMQTEKHGKFLNNADKNVSLTKFSSRAESKVATNATNSAAADDGNFVNMSTCTLRHTNRNLQRKSIDHLFCYPGKPDSPPFWFRFWFCYSLASSRQLWLIISSSIYCLLCSSVI